MSGRNRASAKAAGREAERLVCEFLISKGWIHAERRRMAGSADRGDIAGIPGVVIEVKNRQALDLAGAVNEAETEKANAGASYGVAWLKKRGRSDPREWYVAMTGETFTELLKEAGY